MSARPNNPTTSKVRLGAPLNADLYTTTLPASAERPRTELGTTMDVVLGPSFADHYIVGSLEQPANGGTQKTVSLTHFQRVSITDQHTRNFTITESDILIRTYVMLRSDYPSLTSDTYKLGLPPAVGTADDRFPRYGFTHEAVLDSDFGLDPVFVIVQRFYQKIVKITTEFDQDLYLNIETKTEFIEKGSNTEDSEPGKIVDVDESHSQYDVRVTKTARTPDGNIPVFPYELPSILGDANYDAPPILEDIIWRTVWASAYSDAPPAFDQDFGVEFKMRNPSKGPYPTRTLRFLTDNPDAIRDQYPLTIRPVPRIESIVCGTAYYAAHPRGNNAQASIQTISVPSCVHPEIQVTPPDGLFSIVYTEKLEATPGYMDWQGESILTLGFRSIEVGLGLFIAEVILLGAASLYDGGSSTWGVGSIGGGVSTPVLVPPVITNVSTNAGNVQAVGTATPESVIRIYGVVGGTQVEYGRANSLSDGTFAVTLSTIFRDPTTLYATARKSGGLSLPLAFQTRDLAPLPPEASIASSGPGALADVEGTAQPNATITISSIPPQSQIIKLEVTGVATANTSTTVTLTAAVLENLSPFQFTVYIPDTTIEDDIAGLIENHLVMIASIANHFIITRVDNEITLEARVKAMHDGTMSLSMSAASGVSAASSTTEQIGRGSAKVQADNSGGFSYVFSPALSDNDVIEITASDAGGSSPPLTLIASATAPAPPSIVRFPSTLEGDANDEFDRIIGEGDIGSVVVARYLGEDVGTATVDGSGDFSIDLSRSFVAGETVRVFAHVSGDIEKRSGFVDVLAHSLNLPTLQFSELSNGIIYGTLPASALALADIEDIKVIVRREADPGSEEEVEIFNNLEWSFEIASLMGMEHPPENGERYDIFYRFPQADAPVATKAYPVVPIPMPSVAWNFASYGTTIPSDVGVWNLETGRATYGTAAPKDNSPSKIFGDWFEPIVTQGSYLFGGPKIGLMFRDYWQVVGAPGYTCGQVNPVPVLFCRVPYMGAGTIVTCRYPSSSKATQVFTLSTPPNKERGIRIIQSSTVPGSTETPGAAPCPVITETPCEYKDFTTLVLSTVPRTPHPTWAELREAIPRVMVIEVKAPDGRVVTFNRLRTDAGNTDLENRTP